VAGAVAMKAPPLKADIGAAESGIEPPPPPKIETRSSKGLLDVPARRFAAAGVCDNTCVAAKPDG